MATPRRKQYELEIAFFIIIVLSGVYVAYDIVAEPSGSHPFGHGLGIVGTLLMVMTETLYSVRKRTRLLNWAGPVRNWLAFHIVTGLVGPFLVLMHTGLQFRGLAGLTFGLTALVVGSGFVGRYLYTALRRQTGSRMQAGQSLDYEEQQLVARLQQLERSRPTQVRSITAALQHHHHRKSAWSRFRYRRSLQQQLLELEANTAVLQREIMQLRRQSNRAARQAEQLQRTQRLFQLWHTIHIPIGVTLFTATAVHILAAFYFRAGLFK